MTNDYVTETLDRQYDNCVSLGWFCGTASSLSKLGLRGHSGPFDWYLSHFWAVLKQIENNFQDFMNKDNLEIVEDDIQAFRDAKYGFVFNHDVKNDFESEYEIIYQRYIRRVNVFREMITHPTVFFRCIRDQEEIDFINRNWEYAERLLKSFNNNNHIIYVLHSELNDLTDNVQSYSLNLKQYIGKPYEMRHMFYASEGLLDLCTRLIDTDKMQKNIDFDIMTNVQIATAAYINKCIEENIEGMDDIILDAFGVSRNVGIYLWGAGQYGISLAKYLRDRNVVIIGIIDNNKYSREKIENFDICSFEKINDGAKIFIAVANKESNEVIVKQILNQHKKTTVIRYQDLYKKDLNV